jgi:hypothetical protein
MVGSYAYDRMHTCSVLGVTMSRTAPIAAAVRDGHPACLIVKGVVKSAPDRIGGRVV